MSIIFGVRMPSIAFVVIYTFESNTHLVPHPVPPRRALPSCFRTTRKALHHVRRAAASLTMASLLAAPPRRWLSDPSARAPAAC
jgi:hypothetical protein